MSLDGTMEALRQEQCAKLVDVTGLCFEEARSILDNCNWDLQIAVDTALDSTNLNVILSDDFPVDIKCEWEGQSLDIQGMTMSSLSIAVVKDKIFELTGVSGSEQVLVNLVTGDAVSGDGALKNIAANNKGHINLACLSENSAA